MSEKAYSEDSQMAKESENAALAEESDSGPPDGGLRAWLVVVGGFITYFVTFG